jgi:hypothetical protein
MDALFGVADEQKLNLVKENEGAEKDLEHTQVEVISDSPGLHHF